MHTGKAKHLCTHEITTLKARKVLMQLRNISQTNQLCRPLQIDSQSSLYGWHHQRSVQYLHDSPFMDELRQRQPVQFVAVIITVRADLGKLTTHARTQSKVIGGMRGEEQERR